MRLVKCNGLLQEIIAQYPNLELRDFLAEKLEIPMDKTELLAQRIEKYLEDNVRTVQTPPAAILEKTTNSQPSKKSVYFVECLSQKEFGYFMKWLLEELGYVVNAEKSTDYGYDFEVGRDNRKIAVLCFKNPKIASVFDSIALLSQHLMCTNGCESAIVLSTSGFTEQMMVEAQSLGIELWDSDTLDRKIAEARKKASHEEHYCFPPYDGSLLNSLLTLGKTKDFILESKAGGKYDLFLPGVKYPLLSFQADSGMVVGCVLRIKYNEPVGEAQGTVLIGSSSDGSKVNSNDESVYGLILQYLEGFL